MPTICLQVGQCGNQLGDALWRGFALQRQQLLKAGEDAWPIEFWHPGEGAAGRPRCIRVDTDDKVLQDIAMQGATGSSTITYNRHQVFRVGYTGCGNNWAHGHQLANSSSSSMRGCGTDQDGSCGDAVLEGVRKEVEACDVLPDLLLLASTSGGTGSGVGSALLELLGDAYPAATRGVVAVLPSGPGDVNIAALNSTLALSHLLPCCDLLLAMDNTQALTCLTGPHGQLPAGCGSKPLVGSAAAGTGGKGAALPGRGGSTAAGLLDVNSWMAQGLMGALWPSCGAATLSGTGALRQLASQPVLCDPVMKIWDVATAAAVEGLAAGSPAVWQATLRSLQSQLGKYKHPNHTPLATTTTSSSSSSSSSTGPVPITTLALHLVSRGMPLLAPPAPNGKQRAQSGSWPWWQTLAPHHKLPPVSTTGATKAKGPSPSSSISRRESIAAAVELAVSNWHQLQPGPGLGLEAHPSCSWQQQDVRVRDTTTPTAPCGCTAALSATALASLSSSSVGLWGLASTLGSSGSSSSKALEGRTRPAAGSAGSSKASLTAVAVRSTAGDMCLRLAGVTQELVTAGAFCHWYERYGCSKHMLLEAAQALEELGGYYQLQAQLP